LGGRDRLVLVDMAHGLFHHAPFDGIERGILRDRSGMAEILR